METKASHVLIGSFLLVLMAALFAFVVWVARINQGDTKDYDVFYHGSVTGLAVGAPVRFQGVPIGDVHTIALMPNDPGTVHLRLRVKEGTPILKGAIASLDFQGLTGVAFIQISGGIHGQPEITALPGNDVPIIPSRPSSLESIINTAPQLLEQASETITRVGQILNEDNRKNIGKTVANLEKLSEGLSRRTPELEAAIGNLGSTLVELKNSAGSIKSLANNTDKTIQARVPALLTQTQGILTRSDETIKELQLAVKETKPGLTALGDTTLPELNRLIVNLQALTSSLQSTSDRLNSGGAMSLLSNEKVPEYDNKDK